MEDTPNETIVIIGNLLRDSSLTIDNLYYNLKFDENYTTLVDKINNEPIRNLITSSGYFNDVSPSDSIVNKMVAFYNDIHPTLSNVFKAYLPPIIKDKPYFTTCFWTLIYLYRFHRYSNTELNRNSANCMFFIQDVIDRLDFNKQKKHFVKLVEYQSKYDDVLVDNINGFILSLDSDVQVHKKHFLNYVDSFLSIKSEKKWALSKLNDGSPNKSFMSLVQSKIPSKLPKGYKLAHISVFQVINGISMDDILYKKNRRSFNDHNQFTKFHLKVIREMYKSFRALETLGQTIGLVHNDLHFGNVFFDMNEHVVKFIDYGRMHIAKYEEQDTNYLNNFIKREVMRNCHPTKHDATTYKVYMEDFPFFKSPMCTSSSSYIGYFSDLITFVGNFYVYLTESRLFSILKQNVDLYILEIKENEDDGTISFTPKINKDMLVKNYEECYKNILEDSIITQNRYLYKILILVLDGLTIMVLAFNYLKERDTERDTKWEDVFDPYFKFQNKQDINKLMDFLKTLIIANFADEQVKNNTRLSYFNPMTGGFLCPSSSLPNIKLPNIKRPSKDEKDEVDDVDDVLKTADNTFYFAESYANTLINHPKNYEQVLI
jgi:hypothetical protein